MERARVSRSGIPRVFRNRGMPRRLEEFPATRDPRPGAIIQWTKRGRQVITRPRNVLADIPSSFGPGSWDGQKALPSRCLGRPRCRSTPAPALRLLPRLRQVKRNVTRNAAPLLRRKKDFACCCNARSRRAIEPGYESRNRWVPLSSPCLCSREAWGEREGWRYGHARIRWKDSRRKFVIVFSV